MNTATTADTVVVGWYGEKSVPDFKTRRWHEYDENEPLPPLDTIFKKLRILDFKVEDSGGPWHTVTRKNKIR